jgi:K+-transporting ATPase ATPase C chain
VVYPLAKTGVSQLIFPKQANGSLITVGGKVIGSEIIGQNFSKPEYFHPRPSAAGSGYDASASSGSNLGPTSAKLIHGTTKMDDKKNEVVDYDGINLRMVHYCVDNEIPYESSMPLERFKGADGNLDDVKLIRAFNDDKAPLIFTPKAPIAADAVTASSSGLDPHISPANAQAQASRVAQARGISVDQANQIVARFTEGPDLGLLGEPRVNVLKLNLAMDQQFPRK